MYMNNLSFCCSTIIPTLIKISHGENTEDNRLTRNSKNLEMQKLSFE